MKRLRMPSPIRFKGRVLVTGCRGYIGSRVAAHLRTSFPSARVTGLGRRSRRPGEVACDLNSLSAIGRVLATVKPDAVVHCAGTTRPGPWARLVRAHVLPTLNLLEAVRRNGPPFPRVLVLGSAAEYGAAGLPRRSLAETTAPRPNTPYGISKRLQTAAALAYARLGIPVVIARLFNLLAAEVPAHFAVGGFLRRLERLRGRGPHRIAVGSLRAVRDYMGLPDVLRALALLMVRGRPGEIYNVCSGRATRMGTLFQALARGARKRVTIIPGRLSGGRSTADRCVGNPGKLTRDTGWKPPADVLDLAESLARGAR